MVNKPTKQLLERCLFFTVGKLNRILIKITDEEFRFTGLSPTYGFLLMAVNEKREISQKELGEILHLTPSTVTRFIEKLKGKGLVISKQEGRTSLIAPTEKGLQLQKDLESAWDNVHQRYTDILGKQEADQIIALIHEAGEKLEEQT
ncbi:MarR family transcriptional regulator [Pullulanibacillus camelliae]|uniref:MarR family transcriptional regulator n=1 Tax=Pullulanibacillus camelliae TaxID=1707096 RepID=A0A8J3E0W1_9BACL|nr:MarR family transcriptional regulator [Pullulanibacillus camelliae]GGE55798.1 MarR family transcriptional regulator [Pullulanibacillus camelliae]